MTRATSYTRPCATESCCAPRPRSKASRPIRSSTRSWPRSKCSARERQGDKETRGQGEKRLVSLSPLLLVSLSLLISVAIHPYDFHPPLLHSYRARLSAAAYGLARAGRQMGPRRL